MKYSNTALKILKRRYKSVLLKCAMINMGLLMITPNARALLIDKNILDANSRYEITENIGIGGITDSIIDIDYDSSADAIHRKPIVTVSGKIDGYEGVFSASNQGKYKEYSTFIFKNWNPEQNFKLDSNGFFVFDKENQYGDNSNSIIINSVNSRPHIFLNGNTLNTLSSNDRYQIFLDGFMDENNGHDITLDGYTNHDKVYLFAGGLRNTANGDLNTTIKNSRFHNIYGGGQGADVNGNINLIVDNTEARNDGSGEGVAGVVIGSYLVVDNYEDIEATSVSAAYVSGDINVTFKNGSKAKSVWGQLLTPYGTKDVGVGGTININIEDSLVTEDVRGSTGTSSKQIWEKEHLSINDIVINVTNSTIGGEVISVGSYGSAKDVTININGNTKIGYDENGNQTNLDGWIIAGTSRAGGTIENTTINLDTQGADNIIDIAGHVEVGSRAKDGYMGNINDETYTPSVLGDATLNILGSGIVNAGSFRADHVAGNTTLNLTNVTANAKDDVIGFKEINMDNQSVLTAGLLTMNEDGEVNVVLTDEDNHSQIVVDELDVNGAAINMKIGGEGVYDLIKAATTTSDFTWDLTSNLYTITEDDGTVTVKIKSSDKIAEDLGASEEQADIILGIIDAEDNGTEKGRELAEALRDAIENGDNKKAITGARQIAPSNSQLIRSVAGETANILARVSTDRVNAIAEDSEKQNPANRLWVEVVSGTAEQDSSTTQDGFNADLNGVVFGYDKDLNANTIVGIGYGYMNTKADSLGRDLNIDGHNVFVYGKYQPSQWYVSSVLSYGYGKYEESKSPFGVSLYGEFDVNSYYADVMSGYDFANGITPAAGLRYLVTDADSYSNGVQNVSQEKEDTLTAVIGAKYSKAFETESSYIIKPSIRVAATYDLMADDNSSNVSVYGGGNYRINSERLSRLGFEAGIGVTASFEKWDLSLDYNGSFRDEYNAQSGMVTVKYKF